MANETSYIKIKKYKIYLAIKRTGLFEVCNSVYKNDQIGFRLVKHVQLETRQTRQCYRISCVATVSASFFLIRTEYFGSLFLSFFTVLIFKLFLHYSSVSVVLK